MCGVLHRDALGTFSCSAGNGEDSGDVEIGQHWRWQLALEIEPEERGERSGAHLGAHGGSSSQRERRQRRESTIATA